MFKRKNQVVELPTQEPKRIDLTHDQFISMVIDFESGKMGSEDILIFFCYIVENEKFERYMYPYLSELMNFGVITDEGLVNPLKLKQYKNSKP